MPMWRSGVDDCFREITDYNHVREQHGNEPREIAKNFRVLKKCSSKFDCLIFEMFFIRDLKPKLSKQSDSIRAKLFA